MARKGLPSHDREILRLAAPALGALAAGPLYLAYAMVVALAVFVPLALLARDLRGLWGALLALMAMRLVTLAARFSRGRWIVLGAPAPSPR